MWTLLEQEIVSGSGISWAICKSAPHPRQITTPASHHPGWMPFLPLNLQHWHKRKNKTRVHQC